MTAEELQSWRRAERDRLIAAREALGAPARGRFRQRIDAHLERSFPGLASACAAAVAAAAVSWPSTPVGRGCAISWTALGSARLWASRRPRDSLMAPRPRDRRAHYRIRSTRAALYACCDPRIGTGPRRRLSPNPIRPLRAGSPALTSRLRQRRIAAQAAGPGGRGEGWRPARARGPSVATCRLTPVTTRACPSPDEIRHAPAAGARWLAVALLGQPSWRFCKRFSL
jgi:hypothetical protein